MSQRAVYDTMIFFQWAVLPANRLHQTIQALYRGDIKLCLSPESADEIIDVLTRPELCERYPELTADRANGVLAESRKLADWFELVPSQFTWQLHPDDDHIFNLAIQAKAKYLVTWESRILQLSRSSSPESKLLSKLAPDLLIVTPKELAEILKSTPPK